MVKKREMNRCEMGIKDVLAMHGDVRFDVIRIVERQWGRGNFLVHNSLLFISMSNVLSVTLLGPPVSFVSLFDKGNKERKFS